MHISINACVNVGLWPVSLPNMWESLGKGREYNAVVVELGFWAKQSRGCYSWLILEEGSQL